MLIDSIPALRRRNSLRRRIFGASTTAAAVSVKPSGTRDIDAKVIGLVYEDRVSHARRKLALDGLFVQIGLRPNTEWLVDTVALSSRGKIVSEGRGQTSISGVCGSDDTTTAFYMQFVRVAEKNARTALDAPCHPIRSQMQASQPTTEAA